MPDISEGVLRRVHDELAALRTARAPASVRLVHLAGAGPRLTALLAEVTADGVPAGRTLPLWQAAELLQPLADGVEPGPGQAEDLAEQAAELLADFAATATATATANVTATACAERGRPHRQG